MQLAAWGLTLPPYRDAPLPLPSPVSHRLPLLPPSLHPLQPSAEIFFQFDMLVLLQTGGHMMYCGTLGAVLLAASGSQCWLVPVHSATHSRTTVPGLFFAQAACTGAF